MNTDDITPGGSDRRHFLKCKTWAGTAMVWSVAGGIPRSRLIGNAEAATTAGFNFVQISDSHIGFNKPANPDVAATFRETIARINTLAGAPAFILHTGDLSHLAEAEEFDALEQMLAESRTSRCSTSPASMTS